VDARPARLDPRSSTPHAVDLRRGRAPEVEILACETYDFLISLHVSLASPEETFAAFDVGRDWVAAARARCNARDPQALAALGRYLGDSQPGTLHATLISLVHKCPEPRTTAHFLTWLETLPTAQLAEVLLDQEGLGVDWQALLAAALAELDSSAQRRDERDGRGELALGLLLARYPEDVRPTVAAVMHDLEATRRELVAALRVWDAAVFAAERPRVAKLQRREADILEQRRREVALEPFIEEAMRGVQWQRPVGLRRIVFAPSYFSRPAVFYHHWHGTLTFVTPIEAKIIEPDAQRSDPRAPDEETLRFFLALGDETRLRILRLLAEREMYLTELADRLRLTKATTKHHMVRLRAAGLVTLYDRERLTYYALRPAVGRHAAQFLDGYLGLPSQPRQAPITEVSS
jgi:DNA-binding transcriptional ArsR family regulator